MSLAFTKKQIRRSNRYLIFVNLGLLIILSLVLKGKWRTFYNYQFGPFPLDVHQAVPDSTNQFYFKFTPDEVIDLNQTAERATESIYFRRKKISQSTSDRSKFALARVDSIFILMTVYAATDLPEEQSATEYQGVIADFPGEPEDFQDAVPYLFDATRVPKKGVRWWFWIGVPLGLIFLRFMLKGIWRSLVPMSHPIVKEMRKLGDPKQLLAEVESEVVEDGIYEEDNVVVTRNWFIYDDGFTFRYIPIKEIKWIHGAVSQSSLSDIPGASFAVNNMFFKAKDLKWNSKSIVLYLGYEHYPLSLELASEAFCARCVKALSERSETMLVGYHPDLIKIWEDPEKRKLFKAFLEGKEAETQAELDLAKKLQSLDLNPSKIKKK